jgi:hypothetical protein
MGVVVYSNGITEDYRPKKLVFIEEELVRLFTEFEEIKTCRVSSLINTWCIYGLNDDPNDFNRIVSDIIKEAVYSHALFIHDSEINPEWNATDSVLYKGYNEFVTAMKKIIDETAMNILNEIASSQDYENKVDHLPQLETLGATSDKRILFSYNPDNQSKEFYTHDEFYKFSQKVYEYITKNKQLREPFTIFADKKAVIIIESSKVKKFLNTLLEKFKSKEDYEICTHITKIIDDWTNKSKEPKVKKSRKNSIPPEDQISELNGQ